MKIGIHCESAVDKAAIAIFVGALLRKPLEPINKDLAADGVSAVINSLDGVIRGAHYNSDADALVVVVDSDNTPIHSESHDGAGNEAGDCRYCRTRRIVTNACKSLKDMGGKSRLKVGIGLAVPALEGWLLVGKNHRVKESAWQ